jgi:hypothetical protein
MSFQNSQTGIFRSVERIISRLEVREKLRQYAHEFALSESAFNWGTQEMGPQSPGCVDKTAEGSALFTCGSPPRSGKKDGHDCPNTFKCASPTHTFTRCQGNDNSAVDCSLNPTPGSFDCSTEPKIKFFDCRHFNCAQATAKANFNCKKVLDFLCSARLFDCFQEFKCEAKHYFECADGHACNDIFECSGGNGEVARCLKQPPVYNCTKDQGASGYAAGTNGTDITPGDYYCGVHDGIMDTFYCLSVFTCKADDDFRCNSSSKFMCGSSNGATFECKAGSSNDEGFGCRDHFDCGWPPHLGQGFECDKNTSYKCMKKGEKVEYDCKQPPVDVYNCFGSFTHVPPAPPQG